MQPPVGSAELRAAAAREREPEPECASEQGSRKERWQATHPRLGHCCAQLRARARLLQTNLSAWPRPDPQPAPSPPQTSLAEPLRPPTSTAAPSPARAPHSGEVAALREPKKGRAGMER